MKEICLWTKHCTAAREIYEVDMEWEMKTELRVWMSVGGWVSVMDWHKEIESESTEANRNM